MRTAPTSVRSSSSQSSRLSWQPSQDENLQTAMRRFAIRLWRAHRSRSDNQLFERLAVSEDGTVTAEQQRTELAVAAPADSALHVALERHTNRARGDSEIGKCPDSEPHHDLRTAHESDSSRRVARDRRQELCHDADGPVHSFEANIDGDTSRSHRHAPTGRGQREKVIWSGDRAPAKTKTLP